MYREPISAFELSQHWKQVETLVEGESMDAVPLGCMPPWDEICSELSWNLYLLGGGYFSRKHHGYQGVYRLIGLAEEGDIKRPAKLNRVCGQDTTGTLYIGESGWLNERLNAIRRSKHNAIQMLKGISVLKFPPEKLAVGLLFTGRNHRGIEYDLMRAYINSFGDTPPLNYKY